MTLQQQDVGKPYIRIPFAPNSIPQAQGNVHKTNPKQISDLHDLKKMIVYLKMFVHPSAACYESQVPTDGETAAHGDSDGIGDALLAQMQLTLVAFVR